jgi:hypothetical protein
MPERRSFLSIVTAATAVQALADRVQFICRAQPFSTRKRRCYCLTMLRIFAVSSVRAFACISGRYCV